MADRTVRQERRRSEHSSGATRPVRTDAPRRTGPLLPRRGLGHPEGLAGKADRPRSISGRRLSRDEARRSRTTPLLGLDGVAGLRGRPEVCALQRHRALLDAIFRFPTRRICSSRSCPSRNLRAGAPTSSLKSSPDRAPDQPARELLDGQGRARAHRVAAPLRPLGPPQCRHASASSRRRGALPQPTRCVRSGASPSRRTRTTSLCWAPCAGWETGSTRAG